MKNTQCQKFIDWLVDQTPRFDEMVLKSMRSTDSWVHMAEINPLRIDVRLLPSKWRACYRLYHFKSVNKSKIAKITNLSIGKVRYRIRKSSERIHGLVLNWLNRLPYKIRRKEKRKRKPIAPRWKGEAERTMDRFNSVYANVEL